MTYFEWSASLEKCGRAPWPITSRGSAGICPAYPRGSQLPDCPSGKLPQDTAKTFG